MQSHSTETTTDKPQRLTAKQFAELFMAIRARLWVLASALIGDRTEADDLVQEAAIVALKRLDDYEPGTNFLAWMGKIVRMHALNWRRKQSGRRTSAADPSDLDQSRPAAEQPTHEPIIQEASAGEFTSIQESFDDALLGSLQQLEQIPRACLLLRVVHELTYDEIAAMLEIPSGTAMSHVHRSKRRLRTELASQPSTT